jgi:hypothetical protein
MSGAQAGVDGSIPLECLFGNTKAGNDMGVSERAGTGHNRLWNPTWNAKGTLDRAVK